MTRRALSYLVGRHPVVMAALLVAVIACGYFGWQVIDDARHASRATEPTLEPWMSPRYVGRSWGLRKDDVFRVMEIDEAGGRDAMPRTIADVMARTGLDLEALQRRVETMRETGGQQGGEGEAGGATGDGR